MNKRDVGLRDPNWGRPQCSDKSLSQDHFSTKIPTQSGLVLNPGLRGLRPATDCLNHRKVPEKTVLLLL